MLSIVGRRFRESALNNKIKAKTSETSNKKRGK